MTEATTVDFDLLDEIFSDRVAAVRMLQRALDRARMLAKEIADAAEANSWPGVRANAHQLRGMCANVGAKRLSEAAGRIEEAGNAGGWPPESRLLSDLAAELTRLASAIADALPAGDGTTGRA